MRPHDEGASECPALSLRGRLAGETGNGGLKGIILHVTAGYATHEGMARTATELAGRIPGLDHDLCTNELRTSAPPFSLICEVGGSMPFFPLTRANAIRALIAKRRPDLVHLHGGVLATLLAHSRAFPVPVVASVYGWAGPPSRTELRASNLSELRGSPIAQTRVVLAGLLPDGLVRHALGPGGPIRGVLTQDLEVARKLQRLSAVPVRLAEFGSGVDGRRAAPPGNQPVVVFSGRAETARGVDVVVDAMPEVVRKCPSARLRLLLLPAPQLGHVEQLVRRSPARHAIEVVTDPSPDLRQELAAATVAAFPFKFDHVAPAPPLTVVEAMSVGLPVVVTPVRCMEPVIEARKAALVVPPRDPAATARAILAALEPARWRRLSEEAIGLVNDRWNWDNAARITSALYAEVLDRGH